MATQRNTTIRDRIRTTIAHTKPPCWICGNLINYDLPHTDPQSYVVDHIVPLTKGGPHTLENCAAAHRDCNRTKSDKPHTNTIKRSTSLTRPNNK